MTAISIMKVIVSLLENLDCKDFLADIVNLLCTELLTIYSQDPPRAYMSTVLQCLSMCFFNNCELTLKTLELQRNTEPIIQTYLKFMTNFKGEDELCRAMFGLTSLIKQGSLPSSVP
jgi:hypothetical protein